SVHGTFVNQQQLLPGQRVHVKPTDQVTIGDPGLTINSQPSGEYLFIMPKEIRTVPDGFQSADRGEFQRAIQQSNDYARLHELSSRLEDGFQNAGEKQVFDANGAFSRRTRNATVVDRANDPVLRGVIAEAREKFGQLEPRQRAERLTQYVRDLSYPKGMDGRALDAWNAQFSQQQAGKRVYLGEYIKQGK